MLIMTFKEVLTAFDITDFIPDEVEAFFSKSGAEITRELNLLYGDLYINRLAPANKQEAESYLNSVTSTVFNMYYDKYREMLTLNEIDYNPLDNYNMQENATDNGTRTGDTTTDTHDSAKHSDTSYDTVAPKLSSTDDILTSSSGSNTSAYNDTHVLRRHGNIGVTTTQKMYEAELNLIPKKQVFLEFYKDWKSLVLMCVYKGGF